MSGKIDLVEFERTTSSVVADMDAIPVEPPPGATQQRLAADVRDLFDKILLLLRVSSHTDSWDYKWLAGKIGCRTPDPEDWKNLEIEDLRSSKRVLELLLSWVDMIIVDLTIAAEDSAELAERRLAALEIGCEALRQQAGDVTSATELMSRACMLLNSGDRAEAVATVRRLNPTTRDVDRQSMPPPLAEAAKTCLAAKQLLWGEITDADDHAILFSYADLTNGGFEDVREIPLVDIPTTLRDQAVLGARCTLMTSADDRTWIFWFEPPARPLDEDDPAAEDFRDTVRHLTSGLSNADAS